MLEEVEVGNVVDDGEKSIGQGRRHYSLEQNEIGQKLYQVVEAPNFVH
jgi:hypothetical protein